MIVPSAAVGRPLHCIDRLHSIMLCLLSSEMATLVPLSNPTPDYMSLHCVRVGNTDRASELLLYIVLWLLFRE